MSYHATFCGACAEEEHEMLLRDHQCSKLLRIFAHWQDFFTSVRKRLLQVGTSDPEIQFSTKDALLELQKKKSCVCA